MRIFVAVMIALCGGLAFSACTLRGTTDSVTDSVRNVTVSTSGRTWFTEDGLVRNDQKVSAFVTLNFENLKQDMARGDGEYLSALTTLMQVRDDKRAEFFGYVQSNYPAWISSQQTTPAELLVALNRDLR
ncbi:MAG TPA: DUF3015 family protein [Nitrospirales bacterium]|nr:DUF3015 family protein [Nitrospirales bacterium]